MDAGDDRLRQRGQREHHPFAGIEQAALPALVGGVRAHLFEIVAGTEPAALGSQHHDTHIGVRGGALQLGMNRGDHVQ